MNSFEFEVSNLLLAGVHNPANMNMFEREVLTKAYVKTYLPHHQNLIDYKYPMPLGLMNLYRLKVDKEFLDIAMLHLFEDEETLAFAKANW